MGYNPQESVENTINTMGTLLRAHPIVHWIILGATGFISKESPFVIVPNTSQYSILGFVLLVIFCRFYQGFSHHWTTIWKNIFYFFSASNKQFQVFRSPPYITFGFPFIVPPRREPLAFHRAFRINCRRRSFLKKNLKNLCAAFFFPTSLEHNCQTWCNLRHWSRRTIYLWKMQSFLFSNETWKLWGFEHFGSLLVTVPFRGTKNNSQLENGRWDSGLDMISRCWF